MNRLCSIFIFVTLLAGCTGLKHITPDDPLYIGNRFHIDDEDKYTKGIIEDLDSELRIQPNAKFLWMRPSLARYNMISDSARQKKFWKRRIEPPTFLSEVDPDRISRIIENRLFHGGYFHSHVSYDTIFHGLKKAGFEFDVNLNTPHRFGSITYPNDADTLSSTIRSSAGQTLLKPGEIYSLQILKDERSRIDDYLKDRGFIYFNPDFLSFRADSVSEAGVVNIDINVKPETPPESRTQYFMSSIYFMDDALISEGPLDTLSAHPYYLITADSTISLMTLKRGVFVHPGDLYNRTERNRTTRYLGNLPIIRSTSAQFVTTSDSSSHLDARIFLSKQKRFTYSAEFNTIFRSTNYFGPGVILSFTDRNTRRAAEQLQVNLRGRFEIQIADGEVNPAYELGLELNYTIPRLMPPFLDKLGRSKLPRTRLSVGYNLFNRLDLYRLNAFYLDFSYLWRRNERLAHTLQVFDITFTQIPEESRSDEFNDYIEDNPGVRRSFEEQFVIGSGYEIHYNSAAGDRGNVQFRLGIDAAGNLLDGIYSLANAKRDSLDRYSLLGVPFSQFVRFRNDLSYIHRLNHGSQLAARFVVGLGVPFGNSNSLPYIRQFYVGGTNSLRSFVARSIGPGGEVPPEGFRDLTGDIRLEWNAEYRFTIDGRLKGALFMDVGNVWLFNEDEDRPDGAFGFDTFGKQLAVSGGWGIRFDFDFVVARLDLAYSLRRPYQTDGSYWIQKFKFFRPTFNIAIGYPF